MTKKGLGRTKRGLEMTKRGNKKEEISRFARNDRKGLEMTKRQKRKEIPHFVRNGGRTKRVGRRIKKRRGQRPRLFRSFDLM
jgi:hypothetical protein